MKMIVNDSSVYEKNNETIKLIKRSIMNCQKLNNNE